MQLTKTQLCRGVAAVIAGTARKFTIAWHEYMLFDFDGEVLTLATGNGFGRCQYKFSIQDAECAPFKVSVKASEISRVCSEISGDTVGLSHVGNQLWVTEEKGHLKIACVEQSSCGPQMQFPTMPEVPSESLATLSAAELIHAMRATSPCVDENSEKFALGNMQLRIREDGTAAMYATDGKRASSVAIGGESESAAKDSFLVPVQAVAMVTGLLGKSDTDAVNVYRDGTGMVFTCGGGVVLVTEAAGRFPDMGAFIGNAFRQKKKSRMSVNVADLRSAIKKAVIGYDNSSGNAAWASSVNFVCDGGRVLVLSSAESPNDIEVSVNAADIEGTGCTAIDYKYLSLAVGACGDDSVTLSLIPERGGIIMTIEGTAYRGVIMGITMTVDDGKGKQVPTANALRCVKAMESGQLALV